MELYIREESFLKIQEHDEKEFMNKKGILPFNSQL